jgi:hypothetical protein
MLLDAARVMQAMRLGIEAFSPHIYRVRWCVLRCLMFPWCITTRIAELTKKGKVTSAEITKEGTICCMLIVTSSYADRPTYRLSNGTGNVILPKVCSASVFHP